MYELQGKTYILKKKQVITQCFLLEPLLELDTEKLYVFSSYLYKLWNIFKFLQT